MPGGFRGVLDSVGYATGQPSVVPAGGFRGLLDFVGHSVGMSSVATATPLRSLMGVGLSLLWSVGNIVFTWVLNILSIRS